MGAFVVSEGIMAYRDLREFIQPLEQRGELVRIKTQVHPELGDYRNRGSDQQGPGRYVCPLQWPAAGAQTCPVNEAHWAKGGCVSTLPLSPGARLSHTLDRHSAAYLTVYKQRTATERINSQAVELGSERPKLRNGQAIANLNTLTYTLLRIDWRAGACQRVYNENKRGL
jgi:hypothetical protein